MNPNFGTVYRSPYLASAPASSISNQQASWPIDPNYQAVPKPPGQQMSQGQNIQQQMSQVQNIQQQAQGIRQRTMDPPRSRLETVARAAMDVGSLSIRPQSAAPMYPPPQPSIQPQSIQSQSIRSQSIQPQSISPMYLPSQSNLLQPSFQIGPLANPLYPQPPTGPAAHRRSAPRAFSADPRLLSKHDFDRRIKAEDESFRAMEEERRNFVNAKPYPSYPGTERVQNTISEQAQRQESNEESLKKVNLEKLAAEKAEAARILKAERRKARKQEEKDNYHARRIQRLEKMKDRELRYEEMKVNVVKLESSDGVPVLLRWDAEGMQVLGDHMVE